MDFEEQDKFSKIIIQIVEQDKISFIDAIMEYCDNIGLEPEIAAQLLTPGIISKITEEAKNRKLIKITSPSLPF